MEIILEKGAQIQQTSTAIPIEIPQIKSYNMIVKYITDLGKRKEVLTNVFFS